MGSVLLSYLGYWCNVTRTSGSKLDLMDVFAQVLVSLTLMTVICDRVTLD